jgi:hypothetical protein
LWLKGESKTGGFTGQRILALAKEYGQLPEVIENQEPYWLNRMLLEQDGTDYNAREEARKRQARR